MTKTQRIAAYKAEHPELFKQVNGERLKLTDEEYKATLAEWADNAIAQEKVEAEQAQKEADRTSALTKLTALGLTDDEISALVS
jgi:hypothetical protein